MTTQAHPTVEEILAQARLLSLEEREILLEKLHVDLIQQMTVLLRRLESRLPSDWLKENPEPSLEAQQYHSIMELKGLGKELWQDVDVKKYIEEERSSWRG